MRINYEDLISLKSVKNFADGIISTFNSPFFMIKKEQFESKCCSEYVCPDCGYHTKVTSERYYGNDKIVCEKCGHSTDCSIAYKDYSGITPEKVFFTSKSEAEKNGYPYDDDCVFNTSYLFYLNNDRSRYNVESIACLTEHNNNILFYTKSLAVYYYSKKNTFVFIFSEPECSYDGYFTENGKAFFIDGKRSTISPNSFFKNNECSSYCSRAIIAVSESLNENDLFKKLFPDVSNLKTQYNSWYFAERINNYYTSVKPATQRISASEKIYSEYFNKIPDFTPEKLDVNEKTIIYKSVKKDLISDIETCELVCPCCGAITRFEKKDMYRYNGMQTIVCDGCEREFDSDRIVQDNARLTRYFTNITDIDDNICVAYYSQTVNFQYGMEETYTYPCLKQFAIISKLSDNKKDFRNSIECISICGSDNSKTCRKSFTDRRNYDHYGYSNTISKVFNNAKNLNICWSGLNEYANSFDNGINSLSFDTIVLYLGLYQKYPVLEYISKQGYYDIIARILGNVASVGNVVPTCLNLEKMKIEECFLLSGNLMRNVFAKLPNEYRTTGVLSQLQYIQEFDANVQYDDFLYIITNSISAYQLKEINNVISTNTNKMVEYIERCRISQCINPSESIILWRDYLKPAKQVGVDLTDKTAKYPSSLKREHDIVAFKFNLIKDEQKEKLFCDATKEYGEHFKYEVGDFIMTYPHTMHELLEEGRKLHHCVGTYADRIADGKSFIMFIRKKDEEDVPYFTIEINPHEEKTVQLHGLSNRLIEKYDREKKAYEWLKNWGKVKGIKITV